jgi:predicted ATPase
MESRPSDELIALIRQGIDTYYATGARVGLPYFLSLLAETHAKMGGPRVALHMLDEALSLVSEAGEHLYEAEIYRLKGELLLRSSTDSSIEARKYFLEALSTARGQGSKSLELQAAMSLSRL